jgi:hypothetical protein
MQRIEKILAFMGALIFLAAFAHGATITGTVKGPDGAPLKGAFVQAQNSKTKITVSVLSHKDSSYRVEDLPADEVRRLNTTTGKVTEYPFPHSEITSREYFLDALGRMWYATPSNNKVGYFYLARQGAMAKNGNK